MDGMEHVLDDLWLGHSVTHVHQSGAVEWRRNVRGRGTTELPESSGVRDGRQRWLDRIWCVLGHVWYGRAVAHVHQSGSVEWRRHLLRFDQPDVQYPIVRSLSSRDVDGHFGFV